MKELEAKIQEEGEEQDDDMELEPIPTNLLLADKSLSYLEMSDEQARPEVFPKMGFPMSSPSALAAEQFDHGLQIEALYEANVFKGAAVAFTVRTHVGGGLGRGAQHRRHPLMQASLATYPA